MLNHLAEPLLILDASLALVVLGLYVARTLVQAWSRDVTAQLARRHSEEGAVHDQRERELAIAEIEANRVSQQTIALRRQLSNLRSDAEKVAREHFDIIHLVGEPGGDRRRFEGRLHVPGGPAGLPARIVLASHLVVVYAESLAAAKRLLEVSYAGRTGYSVGPLQEAGTGSAKSAAGMEPMREAAR